VCDCGTPVREFEVRVRDFGVPVRDFEIPVCEFGVPVRGNELGGTSNDCRESAIDYECLFFRLRAGQGNQDRGGRPSLGLSRAEDMEFGDSVKENLCSRSV
jgi:hypothetical protein